MKSYNHRIK